jgi:uncharacterized protein (DUF983 family)
MKDPKNVTTVCPSCGSGIVVAEEQAVAKYCPVCEWSLDHEPSEDCWCNPKVERYDNADLVIHNEIH